MQRKSIFLLYKILLLLTTPRISMRFQFIFRQVISPALFIRLNCILFLTIAPGLVEPDDLDARTLEAARRLSVILQRSAPAGDLVADLTPADIRQVAASVARRIWSRREGLAVLGAQLASVMLQQTAKRLEKPKSLSSSGSSRRQRATVSPTAARTATNANRNNAVGSIAGSPLGASQRPQAVQTAAETSAVARSTDTRTNSGAIPVPIPVPVKEAAAESSRLAGARARMVGISSDDGRALKE
jgi:hypothetical protein